MAELMKGHKWRDHKHKMMYPAWMEIKHDEIRCHVIVDPQSGAVSFKSFAGKPLANMERFAGWFEELTATGVYEFDCGFEVNGNFNDSYRWVRSTKGLKPEMVDWIPKFFLFDLPEVPGDYIARYAVLHSVWTYAAAHEYPIHLPRGWWANDEAHVHRQFLAVHASGYEGLMVKSKEHTYERGARSYGWLKVKPEDDADGRITGINQAVALDGTPHNRAGSITVELEDGSIANPAGLPHELAEDMWANPGKYTGQWCEFRFMERDRQGGYRHPFFHRLREAKA